MTDASMPPADPGRPDPDTGTDSHTPTDAEKAPRPLERVAILAGLSLLIIGAWLVPSPLNGETLERITSFFSRERAETLHVSVHTDVAPRVDRDVRITVRKQRGDHDAHARDHGASSEFADDLAELGYDGLSVDDLVAMRIHGVTPDFIREIEALGYEDVSVDDLVAMRIHGVRPSWIREMSELGYDDLSIDDLVAMRIHGVNADFIREVREMGYEDVSIDDLVAMRIHGVNSGFIRQMNEAMNR